MIKFNCIKFTLRTFMLLTSMIITYGAHAECSGGNYPNPDGTITVSPIIVQRDLPIGNDITRYISANNGFDVECTSGTGNVYYQMLLFQNISQSKYEDVYKTNIDGIGIQFSSSKSYFSNPASRISISGPVHISSGAPRIFLIKIGPTSSGVLKSGILGKVYDDNNKDIIRYHLNGSSITTVACAINTPNIQVPLDSVQGRDLIAIGTTAKPKTFNIGLNCDPNARVNVKVSGEKNTDTTADGVLQLTGAGSNNVATGVGIQILYNNTPVILGSKIVLKTSSGGAETFPFTAQYYQTKAIPSSGSANTVATLDLTYE